MSARLVGPRVRASLFALSAACIIGLALLRRPTWKWAL